MHVHTCACVYMSVHACDCRMRMYVGACIYISMIAYTINVNIFILTWPDMAKLNERSTRLWPISTFFDIILSVKLGGRSTIF